VQVAIPLGSVGHAWPHDPQLAALVIVLAHPPVQRVGVAVGQPDAHAELTHAGVPLSGTHAFEQLPQWALLLVRSTQVPLQLAKPLLHVEPQLPPLHVGVALVTLGHLVPQLPQLFGSVLTSTHVPPPPRMLPPHMRPHEPPIQHLVQLNPLQEHAEVLDEVQAAVEESGPAASPVVHTPAWQVAPIVWQFWQAAPLDPQVGSDEVWQTPLVSQQPAHDCEHAPPSPVRPPSLATASSDPSSPESVPTALSGTVPSSPVEPSGVT
jgi:hypothetical protein